jgi:hypothetical protein
MSQENVEMFRRAGEAFNRRDIDAITDLLTEDFEFIPYLVAVVEPDDDDGFGDETQDQCPTDASTQGPCGGGGGGGGGGGDANDFSFGKVQKNKRKGTAKLTVTVPGTGELDLAKTKKVKPDEERPRAMRSSRSSRRARRRRS